MTTEEQRDTQRRLWTGGDYPAVARLLAPISTALVDRVGARPGIRLLDVGVGDGNTAIEAAQRGAAVTGVDITPAQIERARARITELGVDVELELGDAEDLPFADASFDVVVSVMGMIFAPDAARAASEMHRVCRPGGTVAITAWAQDGWAITWRRRSAKLLPQAPQPSNGGPDAWGDPAIAVERLRRAGLVATATIEPFGWTFPDVDTALRFFVEDTPPMVAFVEAAARIGRRDDGVAALRQVLEESNRATDGSVDLWAPYVVCIATRPEA